MTAPVEPPPLRKGERIEIDILDAAEGEGCFGRLPGGFAVFVHGPVVVGDRVAAEVLRVKRNYAEAGLRDLLSASPARVEPRCAHFGTCGGCKWQQAAYAEQLRLKRKLVVDALERIGGFVPADVAEAIGADEVYHYRNKIEFSFGDRRYLTAAEQDVPAEQLAKPRDFAVGFHAPNLFSKVIDIDRCHIATEPMNVALDVTRRFCRGRGLTIYSTFTHTGFLRNLVLRQTTTGELMIHLITSTHEPDLMRDLLAELLAALGPQLTTFINGVTARKNTVAYAEHQHVLHGPGVIVERLGRLHFAISPSSFFQTNTKQAEKLYATIRTCAGLQPDDLLHDLYCGTGSIGLFCADACRRVVGFELEASSVRDAAENAKRNGVANASFHHIDLKNWAATLATLGPDGRADVVITDPPRAGMHEDAVRTLLEQAPRRIVYVSCNPASLARDAKMLCADGRYRLGRVHPVDLFPHTQHIESVAVLERNDAP